jgi:hypothetical protein
MGRCPAERCARARQQNAKKTIGSFGGETTGAFDVLAAAMFAGVQRQTGRIKKGNLSYLATTGRHANVKA